MMFRKTLSFVLVGLLVQMGGGHLVSANTKAEKEARFAEKVKVGVAKLGVGEDARISVKLRDKTKLKGYVSAAGEDHFVITDTKTGGTTTVAYANVVQVKGNNLSDGAFVAIAVGIAVLVVILAAAALK